MVPGNGQDSCGHLSPLGGAHDPDDRLSSQVSRSEVIDVINLRSHEQRRTTRRAPCMLPDWCNQHRAWRVSPIAVTIRRELLLRRPPALMSRRACGAGRQEDECCAHEMPRAREGARRSRRLSRTCSQTRTGEPSAEPRRKVIRSRCRAGARSARGRPQTGCARRERHSPARSTGRAPP